MEAAQLRFTLLSRSSSFPVVEIYALVIYQHEVSFTPGGLDNRN